MKYSALMLFVFMLVAVPLSAMQDLYLDFFNASSHERDVYDTNAWGVRTWDERYQLWRYEKNITVQHVAEYDQIIQTVITFSHYEPIVLFGEWQDKRFVESQGSTVIDMTSDYIAAQKWANDMSELCQRFNAYAQYNLLDSYDTKPWGNRQWDDRYNYWEYELGVTVEPRERDRMTIVTFPAYEPIRVHAVWHDKRFAASSSLTTAASSSSMSVSTSSTSSSSSSIASSFIKRLHDKYMKDQFVDEAAWGNTKQYNDDLTAYTYLETGIRVDLCLGVVTFPGFQGSLPLPEGMVVRTVISQHSTQSAQQDSLFANIRSTVATLCVAAFMWCLHPES